MARNNLELTLSVMMRVDFVELDVLGATAAVFDFLRSLDAAVLLVEGAMFGGMDDEKVLVVMRAKKATMIKLFLSTMVGLMKTGMGGLLMDGKGVNLEKFGIVGPDCSGRDPWVVLCFWLGWLARFAR